MSKVEENIQKIVGAAPSDAPRFEVEDVDETLNQVVEVAKEVKKTGSSNGKGNKQVEIIVHEQENSDQNQPAFATHPGTGKQYYIPRGVKWVVPYAVYKNLDDCVVTKTVVDSTGKGTVKNIHRYSVELLREL